MSPQTPRLRRAAILPVLGKCRPNERAVHGMLRGRDSSALHRLEPTLRDSRRLLRAVLAVALSRSRSSNLTACRPALGTVLRHCWPRPFAARRSLSLPLPWAGHPPCSPDARTPSQCLSRADSWPRSEWLSRGVWMIWWPH
jgi:hypothetical protein